MHPMSTRLRSVVIGNTISQGGKQLCYDAADELDKLHAIVSRLPVTADGVPVVSGMDVWYIVPASGRDDSYVVKCNAMDVVVGNTHFSTVTGKTSKKYRIYSTREAAESARAAKEADDAIQ